MRADANHSLHWCPGGLCGIFQLGCNDGALCEDHQNLMPWLSLCMVHLSNTVSKLKFCTKHKSEVVVLVAYVKEANCQVERKNPRAWQRATQGTVAVGCGTCMACRNNQLRIALAVRLHFHVHVVKAELLGGSGTRFGTVGSWWGGWTMWCSWAWASRWTTTTRFWLHSKGWVIKPCSTWVLTNWPYLRWEWRTRSDSWRTIVPRPTWLSRFTPQTRYFSNFER